MAKGQCYHPDGSEDTSTPCDESADQSHCCGVNDFCLSNGHCLEATAGTWSNRIARGTCTDSAWRSDACPTECHDVKTSSDITIFLAYDTLTGAFCCDQAYNTSTQQCPVSSGSSGNKPFDMPTRRIIWNRTDGSVMSNGTLLVSEVQLFQANATITLQPSSSSNITSHSHAAVAAEIAVPLGVLLLASLGIIVFLASKLKKFKKQIQASIDFTNHTANMQPYGYSPERIISPLPKYQPAPFFNQHVNEAPVESELVEADAQTPAQELGSEGESRQQR